MILFSILWQASIIIEWGLITNQTLVFISLNYHVFKYFFFSILHCFHQLYLLHLLFSQSPVQPNISSLKSTDLSEPQLALTCLLSLFYHWLAYLPLLILQTSFFESLLKLFLPFIESRLYLFPNAIFHLHSLHLFQLLASKLLQAHHLLFSWQIFDSVLMLPYLCHSVLWQALIQEAIPRIDE